MARETMNVERCKELGIELTPLEERLLCNPHFQAIRASMGPTWHGLSETILHAELVEGGGLEPLPGEPTSPHAIGRICDQHLRPLFILCATIRRDADLTNPRDRQLVADLCAWLGDRAHPSATMFHWDREADKIEDTQQNEERKLAIAEQRFGYANALLLLPTRLTVAEKHELEEQLRQYCIGKRLFPADARYNYPQRARYFPAAECVFCSASVGSYSYASRFAGHGWGQDSNRHRLCNSDNVFCLLDCGDAKEILASVPTRLIKLVRKVRFRIPRWVLLHDESRGDYALPHMLIFGLDQLTIEEQAEIHTRLSACLGWAKDHEWLEESISGEATDCRRLTHIYSPVNSRRMDALVIAGPGHVVHGPSESSLFPWGKVLTENGRLSNQLFDLGRITISSIGRR